MDDIRVQICAVSTYCFCVWGGVCVDSVYYTCEVSQLRLDSKIGKYNIQSHTDLTFSLDIQLPSQLHHLP